MGSNCSNLYTDNDICTIYKCVENVVGIPSNSQSPIDTWTLNFKNGTRYDCRNVEKGFVKISVSHNSLINTDTKCNLMYLFGLEYEIKVYKNVIKPLIDNNICPNFIMYYASGQCSFENLKNILTENSKENHDEIEEKLKRNMTIIANCLADRPSINDASEYAFPESYVKFDQDWRYNILAISTMKNFETFSKYIKRRGIDFLDDKDEETHRDYKIIFQIFAACYAMSLSKMVHNDLHLENIFVEQIPEQEVSYGISGLYYTFTTDVKVKIYDYDSSYVEHLGPNLGIPDFFCSKYSYCNIFTENFDIITVLIKIFKIVSNKDDELMNNRIRRLFYPLFIKDYIFTSDSGKIFAVMVKNGYVKNDVGSIIEELRNFKTTLSIIKGFCGVLENKNVLRTSSLRPNLDPDSVFVCKSSMFKPDGTLKIKSIN